MPVIQRQSMLMSSLSLQPTSAWLAHLDTANQDASNSHIL